MSSPDPTSGAIPAPPAIEPMKPGDEAPAGTPGTAENVCPECGGSGRRDGEACAACGGSGKVLVNVGDA